MVGNQIIFLDVAFDQAALEQIVEEVALLAGAPGFSYVVTPNVDHMVRLHGAQSEHRLWQAYREASLRLCDSRILRLLAGLSGIRLSLATGSDLTERLLDWKGLTGLTLAVVGGDAKLLELLGKRRSDVEWVHHDPPMGVLKNPQAWDETLDFVEQTAADITMFAIGFPQSELLCSDLVERGKARGLGLCIGASLEFSTRVKRRAPALIQWMHLEWLFRLLQEPRRLWRRYLIQGPKIFVIWWRWCGSARRGR